MVFARSSEECAVTREGDRVHVSAMRPQVLTSFPVATSQSFTLNAWSPVATRVPSGETATHQITSEYDLLNRLCRQRRNRTWGNPRGSESRDVVVYFPPTAPAGFTLGRCFRHGWLGGLCRERRCRRWCSWLCRFRLGDNSDRRRDRLASGRAELAHHLVVISRCLHVIDRLRGLPHFTPHIACNIGDALAGRSSAPATRRAYTLNWDCVVVIGKPVERTLLGPCRKHDEGAARRFDARKSRAWRQCPLPLASAKGLSRQASIM